MVRFAASLRLGLAAAALVAAAACGPVERREESGSAAQAAEPAALDPASLAAADLERGELLGLACQACHTFERGAAHNIGPNLYGVFGRPAATRDDFGYSPALESAGLVWSPVTLDRWLRDPTGFVPGSSMTFAGYANPVDRRDLIAYLMSALDAADAER